MNIRSVIFAILEIITFGAFANGIYIFNEFNEFTKMTEKSKSKVESIITEKQETRQITMQTTTNIQTITQTETIQKEEVKTIKISFLGDCTIATNKNQKYKNSMENCLQTYPSTYFFEKCAPYITEDDFTIANCENVFTPEGTKAIGKNHSPAFWFRTDPMHANVFSSSSIDAVSIANNHTNDYGAIGYENTKKALTDVGVQYGEDNSPIILEKDGIKIAIICVTFWNEWYVNQITQQIQQASETTDLQIVFFHGGKEGKHSPEKWKIQGCRKFVDVGADLVVGGHPHVLQPYEEYNGVSIIYSIGNFCFGGNRSPENRTIIYQQTFEINEEKKLINSKENIIPFYVFTGTTNNWQPAPIEDEQQKQKVLEFVYQRSNSLF